MTPRADFAVCDAAAIPATPWGDFVKDWPVVDLSGYAELDLTGYDDMETIWKLLSEV
jgi:hypothetical protein